MTGRKRERGLRKGKKRAQMERENRVTGRGA